MYFSFWGEKIDFNLFWVIFLPHMYFRALCEECDIGLLFFLLLELYSSMFPLYLYFFHRTKIFFHTSLKGIIL